MKMVLIEKHGVYVEDGSDRSVDFSNLDELQRYAFEFDFSDIAGLRSVTYEPDRSMHIWFDGVNTIVKSLPDPAMEGLISSVLTLKARKSDILFGLEESVAYRTALDLKLAELDGYRDNEKNLENYYFTWDNGTSQYIYVDDTSIEKMLTACRQLPPSALVLTAGGLWKTADAAGVDNIYVPTTVGELTRMRDELIIRGLYNWGFCDAHKKLLKNHFSNRTMTPREILNYNDYKTNWSLS